MTGVRREFVKNIFNVFSGEFECDADSVAVGLDGVTGIPGVTAAHGGHQRDVAEPAAFDDEPVTLFEPFDCQAESSQLISLERIDAGLVEKDASARAERRSGRNSRFSCQ